jgi:hypothetical protein
MEEKIKKMEEDLLPFGFLSSEMDNSDQDAIDLGRESKPKNTPQYGDFNDSGTYGGW